MLPTFHKLPTLSEERLARFISHKVTSYVEPTKKGTPKGDPVGFSLTKYKATLYALRERVLPDTLDLVIQAKKLGVSYGVLRKWRSEQKFKEIVSQHVDEFTRLYLRPPFMLKGREASIRYRLDALREATVDETASERTKETLRKRMILVHDNLRSALAKSDVNSKTVREYQIVALDQAIELLKDRRATQKHRKAIIDLLSGIRETLE
jgi:hypothetical protein